MHQHNPTWKPFSNCRASQNHPPALVKCFLLLAGFLKNATFGKHRAKLHWIHEKMFISTLFIWLEGDLLGLMSISIHVHIYLIWCVHACRGVYAMPWFRHRNQRTTLRRWLNPAPTWVPGTELGFSEVSLSHFTDTTVPLWFFFLMFVIWMLRGTLKAPDSESGPTASLRKL